MTPDPPDLLNWLASHLVLLGPGVLFVVCVMETAVFAGLILPVGGLIAFAALLSARGLIDPAEVVFVALAGALVGDQIGFVVGRWFISRARPPAGRIGTLWGSALGRTESLVLRRGLLGVSTARAIPFVRTMMPWVAGRSGISWPRFLLFDALGVMLWGAIYIGGGFLAGRGWLGLVNYFGEVAGGALLVSATLAALLLTRRFLRTRIASRIRRRFPRPPASVLKTIDRETPGRDP